METKIGIDMIKERIKRKLVKGEYMIEHGKFEETKGRMPTEEEKRELREAAEKTIKEGILILNVKAVDEGGIDIAYNRNIFETPHFRLVHKSDDTYDIFYSGYNEIIAPEHSVSRTDVLEKLLTVYEDCEKEEGSISHMKRMIVNATGQLLREEIDKDKTLKEYSDDKKEFEELIKDGN